MTLKETRNCNHVPSNARDGAFIYESLHMKFIPKSLVVK